MSPAPSVLSRLAAIALLTLAPAVAAMRRSFAPMPGGVAGEASSEHLGELHAAQDVLDEAYLCLVSNFLAVFDGLRATALGRPELLEAARDDNFPNFQELVASIFAYADRNADGVLDAAEAETFASLMREHVARARADCGNMFSVLATIYKMLHEVRHNVVPFDRLVVEAVGLRAPELLNSVVEFFRAADADGDGCLDAVEGDAFAALLDDRYLYGADDNSSDDAGSFDDAGSYDGAGIDDDGGSDYEDADGRSDASDWPPELVEELQPIS
mmetsp:Transcript_5167/g.14803  ORF Transcript_5167/g.14803 Transcript_5167/m.14803 type:complete len:271 (+) Transcript_5167:87-899(+)